MTDVVKGEPLCLDCRIEYPHSITMPLFARLYGKFYEGEGEKPTTILYCGSKCYLEIYIDFEGCDLARLLCLKWCVKVAFEACGTRKEFELPVKYAVQQVCETKCVKIEYDGFDFPECDPCGTMYTMCVTVTARDMCDDPAPFGGYCRGQELMVFPAKKQR